MSETDRKTIEGLEALLKQKEAELEAAGQKMAIVEEGARQLSLMLDAIMITTALAYGTEVPLGMRMGLPVIDVGKILEEKELHVTKTEDGMELTALDKKKTTEIEETMQ